MLRNLTGSKGNNSDSFNAHMASDLGSTNCSNRGRGIRQRFENLIKHRSIVPNFQPIVSTRNNEQVFGYELLARGAVAGLESPAQMFSAAEYLQRAAELSELCRAKGFEVADELPPTASLFVNTHPSESLLTFVLPSLHRMRRQIRDRKVIIEIHEGSITDSETLNEFTNSISELNVELAFDDFGVGRARLLELIHVPPAFVKFDANLTRGIDRQPKHHEIVLRHLIKMVKEIGSCPIAEGVESESEAAWCRDLGFEFAQGFFFSRPVPVSRLR